MSRSRYLSRCVLAYKRQGRVLFRVGGVGISLELQKQLCRKADESARAREREVGNRTWTASMWLVRAAQCSGPRLAPLALTGALRPTNSRICWRSPALAASQIMASVGAVAIACCRCR